MTDFLIALAFFAYNLVDFSVKLPVSKDYTLSKKHILETKTVENSSLLCSGEVDFIADDCDVSKDEVSGSNDLRSISKFQHSTFQINDADVLSLTNHIAFTNDSDVDISARQDSSEQPCQILRFKICNEKDSLFNQLIPITIYNDDPLTATDARKIVLFYTPPAPLVNGECAIFSTPIDNELFWDRDLYVIINDDGSSDLPVSLTDDFPNTPFAESAYDNNILSKYIEKCVSLEICDNGEDDDDDGLIDYADPDCPCENSSWDSGLDYLPYEVFCGSTFTIGVAFRSDYSYQWYKDGVEIADGQVPTIFIPTGNDRWIGEYFVEVRNLLGCESLEPIFLEPQVDSSLMNASVCIGELFVFQDSMYAPGSHFITLIAERTKCDSVVNLMVNEVDFINMEEQVSICAGDIFTLNGMEYNQEGSYIDTIFSEAFCDTIVNLNLSIIQPTISTISLSLCEGDTMIIAGQTIVQSAQVFDTISTQRCDSIIEYNIVLDQRILYESDTVICNGESLFFNEMIIADEGVYRDTIINSEGCQDIYLLNVIKDSIPKIELPETFLIEPGETYFISIQGPSTNDLNFNWYDAEGALIAGGPDLTINSTLQPFVVLESYDLCSRLDTFYIEEIALQNDFYLPNVFSPNNDGVNDLFEGYVSNITQLDVTIFDRWGNLIHNTINAPTANRIELWDGLINGKPSDTGVYTYIIKANTTANEEIIKSGSVALVK